MTAVYRMPDPMCGMEMDVGAVCCVRDAGEGRPR